VGDFSRATSTLRVQRSRSENLRTINPTKTYGRVRPITLSADLAADVATLCGVRGHDEPLIQGVYESSFTKIFARAQTALGLRYRSAYQAKHAYATLALQDGENPALVARNLGISLSTLTNHYVAALQRGQLIRAEKASENPTKTPQRS
jgi:integrase